MTRGFDNNAGGHVTVSVSQLRDLAENRLQSAKRRLDPASASAAFAKANDRMGHDALVGSIIFGLLTWVPFMQGLESAIGHVNGSQEALGFAADPMFAVVADGSSVLFDERSQFARPRKVGSYHGGRRQDKVFGSSEAKLNNRFNLVSANENRRYAYDAGAEVACMMEIIGMLDQLEHQGVSLLRLEAAKPAKDALRTAEKERKNNKGIMRNYSMPVRMAI